VASVTLTAITTGFNNPVGIDYHEPTDQVVMSVNFPNGMPNNFELVARDGTRTPFSSVSGFTEEVKIATVRSGPHQGGFTVGELFTGNGRPGEIVRISPDGSAVQNPWVTLPREPGLLRGSLFQDRYGVFGGDLIVATTGGSVWRVTSAGTPKKLAEFGMKLEGLTTVPDVPSKYGPWAGKILVGAEQDVKIHTVDASGNTQTFTIGVAPEDIEIIPSSANFYGVDFGGRTLWGAPASEFVGMVGDFLIPQELGGILWHVWWDAASGSFQAERVAQVGMWEHVTFAPVGFPRFQYAVKFICGTSKGDAVAPGVYYTAINIHNPNDEELTFTKKFAVALPWQRPGPVSRQFDGKLGPDEACEIDCAEIFARTHPDTEGRGPNAEFVKGFVVIESQLELDIVAVYTAAGREEFVETLHVERVAPRDVGLPEPDDDPTSDDDRPDRRR
jgi:hypothetical protein